MSDFDEKTLALLNEIIEEYKNFDVGDIVKILPKLIIHLKLYKTLTGLDKRNHIINIFNYIVDKTDGPGDDAVFDPIIKNMVPEMIDLLIEVDSGKLRLKKNKCSKLLFLCK